MKFLKNNVGILSAIAAVTVISGGVACRDRFNQNAKPEKELKTSIFKAASVNINSYADTPIDPKLANDPPLLDLPEPAPVSEAGKIEVKVFSPFAVIHAMENKLPVVEHAIPNFRQQMQMEISRPVPLYDDPLDLIKSVPQP